MQTPRHLSNLLAIKLVLGSLSVIGYAQDGWRSEVLPVELGVGYAVLPLDINGDNKLDIAIVDSKRFIWLENPTWQTHVMHATPDAKFDNVCFAPHDVDSDGHIDFAVGYDWQFTNTDSGGAIGWLRSPADPRQPWTLYPLATEPTTHRMRWMDWNHDGIQELIVAPLKGKHSKGPGFTDVGVRLLAFQPEAKNPTGPWRVQTLDDTLHVMHNFDIVDRNRDGKSEIITASFEGVTHLELKDGQLVKQHLGSGQEGEAPAIGSSEIRLGHLAADTYIATIEPWHGDRVVVYTEPKTKEQKLWTRHVLDRELKWGHAVACANLDQDPEEELIVGVRDPLNEQHRSGIRIYDPQRPEEGLWSRTLVEPGQVAVEDLATGDFDGDGDIDIVAVGRATHNAVIYWND
jgi:hypothetical protein